MKLKTFFFLIILFFISCQKEEKNELLKFPKLDISFEKMNENIHLGVDEPWESIGIGYINVIQTDSIWHLWYESYDEKSRKVGRGDYNGYFCYANSSDGVNWNKPDLGLSSYNNETSNNILISNEGNKNGGIHGATVFIDSLAAPDERYKMVYARWVDGLSTNWIYGMVSPDGIHWNNERLLLKHYSDTQTVCFVHDGKYHLYVRYWDGDGHSDGFRQIGYTESKKFNSSFEEIKPVEVFNAPEGDIHLYTNAARPINDSIYVIFPSIYFPAYDKMHLKLAYSGVNTPSKFYFNNYDSEYLIENSNDYRVVLAAPQSIRYSDNSFWLYYNGKKHGHRTSLNSYAGSLQRTLINIIPKENNL